LDSEETAMTQAIGVKDTVIPVLSQTENVTGASPKGGVRPEDIRGTALAGSRPADTHTVNSSPTLPLSRLDPSDMMIQLTALMSKLAEMNVKVREVELESERKELKLHHQNRMVEMKAYYDKMEEAKEHSVGFFSRMVRAVKAAVAGDIGRAFEEFGKGIAQNPMTFLGVLAAIATPAVAVCAPHLLVVCIPLVIHCLTQAAQDGELMQGLGELCGMGRDGAETFANVMKWVGLGTGIGSTVALCIVIGVVGIAAAPVSGGASAAASILLVSGLMGAAVTLSTVPLQVESGIKSHLATSAQSEAYEKGTQADKSKAESQNTLQVINKELGLMQEMFDALQNTINGVMRMLAEQQRGNASAAGAV
jgi:hypothetical protein